MQFSTDNKGIFRIGAVDCDDQPKICEKEKVNSYPTFKVYPPFPAPVFDVEVNDKFETKMLRNKAGRFINDRSIEITHSNHKAFVNEDIATPKVILFSNAKKGTPFIYKALSAQLEKTMQFGLIRDSEDGLAKQYKVKNYPALFVIKDGKPIRYEEKEFTFTKIFEFINVYSQIFVDPTSKENDVPKTSSASKPWLITPVPQLTSDSGNDVCLQKGGVLCIVLVAKDANSIDQNILEQISSLGEEMESKISRGISFNFMWLDSSADKDFADVFAIEGDLPRVVVLNPGKRKRFLVHEGVISKEGVQTTLDKILGGDARFKNIKGNKLPDLVSVYPKETKE